MGWRKIIFDIKNNTMPERGGSRDVRGIWFSNHFKEWCCFWASNFYLESRYSIGRPTSYSESEDNIGKFSFITQTLTFKYSKKVPVVSKIANFKFSIKVTNGRMYNNSRTFLSSQIFFCKNWKDVEKDESKAISFT